MYAGWQAKAMIEQDEECQKHLTYNLCTASEWEPGGCGVKGGAVCLMPSCKPRREAQQTKEGASICWGPFKREGAPLRWRLLVCRCDDVKHFRAATRDSLLHLVALFCSLTKGNVCTCHHMAASDEKLFASG